MIYLFFLLTQLSDVQHCGEDTLSEAVLHPPVPSAPVPSQTSA